jgi:outer membrane receptor protein involved in Fe transport
MAKVRFSIPVRRSGTTIAAEAQALSSRLTLPGSPVGSVPAYTVANLTITQPIGRTWEVVATARNLFDVRYADPGSVQHRQETLPRDGRTLRIGLRWRFWQP